MLLQQSIQPAGARVEPYSRGELSKDVKVRGFDDRPPVWSSDPVVEALRCAKNHSAIVLAYTDALLLRRGSITPAVEALIWAREGEARWLKHFETVAKHMGRL